MRATSSADARRGAPMSSAAAPTTATGRAPTTPIVPAVGDARALLEAFFDAQRARERAYERWNASYASTLAGATTEEAFVETTKDTTVTMRDLSAEVRSLDPARHDAEEDERALGRRASSRARELKNERATTDESGHRVARAQILAIEEGLRHIARASAATLVRIVQQNERVRLEMTCALQVLKRAAARRAWAWQRDDAKTEDATAEPSDTTLQPTWARSESSHANGGEDGCAVGCACARERDAAPEPTEDEYVNAVGEATQTLERAFGEINDALEELRYELEEVRLEASDDG